jgi:hypothetical protein
LDKSKTANYKISDEVLYPKTPSQEHAFPRSGKQDLWVKPAPCQDGLMGGPSVRPSNSPEALGKRIISIQAPDFPQSVWTVMCRDVEEIYNPIHMDQATYDALIEHSDYDLHPAEMMLPVSNAVPS